MTDMTILQKLVDEAQGAVTSDGMRAVLKKLEVFLRNTFVGDKLGSHLVPGDIRRYGLGVL